MGEMERGYREWSVTAEVYYETAPMYEAEAQAAKRAHEKKLDVATEMRMPRRTRGITKPEIIGNERIGGTTKTEEISATGQQKRWPFDEKRR